MLTRIACTIAVVAGTSTGASRARAETPRQDNQAGRCLIVHSTLHVDSQLRAIVHAMWHRSPTFQRQVARLSQEVDLDTTLNIWTPTAFSDRRADTLLRHDAGGLRSATVRIKLPNRESTIVELIAHELEHIVEQLDGVNLRLAASRSGVDNGVRRSNAGHFETERAHRVGLAVMAEYLRQSAAGACVEVQS